MSCRVSFSFRCCWLGAYSSYLLLVGYDALCCAVLNVVMWKLLRPPFASLLCLCSHPTYLHATTSSANTARTAAIRVAL